MLLQAEAGPRYPLHVRGHCAPAAASGQVIINVRCFHLHVTLTFLHTRDRVTLACGQYTGDWFELEAGPGAEGGRAEWAEHKRSMAVEWERRRRSKQLGRLPSHQNQS